ncbi:M24 family metallopeptidase [Deinococcus fonticola]|uniref:M24 family metallopeptidase n=1 Tax=Deinococcus fonticola TaxID=2528713 RepID=UPI001074BB65|nr:M24 family metallopeptidase [Deinococcus fonticola]
MLHSDRFHAEKRLQAQALLAPGELWVIAARESKERPEPVLKLLADVNVTWDSLFLLSRDDAAAIVGRFDADAVPDGWRVRPYDADLTGVLNEELRTFQPRRVLVNISETDPLCDGLTVGLYRRLQGWFAPQELHSAEHLLGQLRSVKTPAEQQALREAVDVAEAHLEALRHALRPGWTAPDVVKFMHERCAAVEGEPSWGWSSCPNVHIGPQARPSHALSADTQPLEPGMLLHIDYGVRLPHGYCSDIQRTYYLPRDGEGIPSEVQQAFGACWQAIEEGANTLRPGVPGWQVDAAARATLVSLGYPEYQHALGHGLGRATHDGGTLLGPRWPRYGAAVEGQVRVGEVYTLELGTFVEGYGFVGLEEDVVVQENGLTWLSQRQNK